MQIKGHNYCYFFILTWLVRGGTTRHKERDINHYVHPCRTVLELQLMNIWHVRLPFLVDNCQTTRYHIPGDTKFKGLEMYARKQNCACLISVFYHSVNEICAVLELYAAQNGSFVPTFRDNLSLPYSRVKHSPWTASPVKMEPISCSETSSRNYHSKLRKIPKPRKSQKIAYHLQF
jgi:hypothetical protein